MFGQKYLQYQSKKVKDICRKRNILKFSHKKKLDALLNQFIKKRTHLALIFDEYDEFIGIVTLEDIIEEVLKTEIVDEYDRSVDLRKLARKK